MQSGGYILQPDFQKDLLKNALTLYCEYYPVFRTVKYEYYSAVKFYHVVLFYRYSSVLFYICQNKAKSQLQVLQLSS